ncbi:ATP phosphoribosyltransferase regulatory subunit [Temperatibacter marinus]|uniref:ATP phosphoribosyltransferase regulatory subunit n=1 Tax=Temperatibacter marinus TaxID=1456591 RepID=A0AA52EH89_9PROT|nr:ATP phosphoribosyltransferase regulatory subunit [Temperatibacter marinus]WND03123.1 ATP phosphoribosyltransferase regulatory subunit [Temperatibacter marinus]
MTQKDAYTDPHYAKQALLPEGLRDHLPPYAELEAETVHSVMGVFQSYGYERVSPPLVEFEDSLLIGPAAKNSDNMFRLMDPESRKVMALRSDMTTQIARIASTRLKEHPRPLRLAYSGNVLRVKGSQIRPTRQFCQAGFELIGDSGIQAQIEVIRVAIEGLTQVGLKDLSVDLTIAPFVPAVCADLGLDQVKTAYVRAALDARDVGALQELPTRERKVFEAILQSAGDAQEAVHTLKALAFEGESVMYVIELARLVEALALEFPSVALTVDPGESHGFDYKIGVGFALFSKSVHGELGRGGRYQTSFADGSHESAIGFSMYLDRVMNAIPVPEAKRKVYVPHSVSQDVAKNYRLEGWCVIQGLTDEDNSLIRAQEIAASLGCSHIHSNGECVAL